MSVYKLTLIAMFAALTAVGAFIRIPLPYIPITLQVFFVFLSGALLGARMGALSQIVYLLLGLVGLPIFAEGGGLGYIFHPTFGFLLGFILVSYYIGFFLHDDKELNFTKTLIVCITAIVILYAVGVPYLYMILKLVLGIDVSFTSVLAGMLIFIPADIIKAIGVALIAPRIRTVIKTIT